MVIFYPVWVMREIELLVRFSLIFFIIFQNSLFAQTHPNPKVDFLLKLGIKNILLQNYDKADSIFIELNRTYPNLPLGDIYRVGNFITKSVDYEEKLNEDFVEELLDSAEYKIEILLNEDDEDIWNNYYEALFYGYRAYFYTVQGNLLNAFADGIYSLNAFNECLSVDNKFYEAYIAAGTYNYWKSAQSKSFLWLPFVKDKREEGIELLEEAIQHSSYNHHLAAYSLVWIYIDYELPQKAVNLSLQMLEEYPNSRYFRWGLARAYQDIDKTKAIKVYRELLKSIENISNRNLYNDVVLRHKIAMLEYDLGNYKKALTLCNEILDFKLNSAEIKQRLQDRLSRVKVLKEKITEIISDN